MIANNDNPSNAVNGDFMHVVADATDSPWLPPLVSDIPEPNTGYMHDRCDRCDGRRRVASGRCPRCHGMGYTRRLVEYPIHRDPAHRWPPPGRVLEVGDWHE